MTDGDTADRYRCTECGTIHDELPDHCPTCGATAGEFFEVVRNG